MVGLPVGDCEGEFGAVGGGRGVCFYLFWCWDGAVSESFEDPRVWRSLQVCVESLSILNGERSRGGGGGKDCDGVVARAVERQRMQVLCWRDWRRSRFQELNGRSEGAVEAMFW